MPDVHKVLESIPRNHNQTDTAKVIPSLTFLAVLLLSWQEENHSDSRRGQWTRSVHHNLVYLIAKKSCKLHATHQALESAPSLTIIFPKDPDEAQDSELPSTLSLQWLNTDSSAHDG